MLGCKRMFTLTCILLVWARGVLPEEDEDDGDVKKKRGGFRGGSDEDSEGGCEPLTMKSLRLMCQGPDGEVNCKQPEAGTKARVIFKKTIAKRNNAAVSEITCKAGVWKPDASKSKKQGYTNVNNIGSYKLYKDKRSWDEASETCQKDGAQLLVIDSQDELTAIQRICDTQAKFTKVADEGLYIGVNDKDQEGNFKTVYGKTFSNGQLLDWAPNQPDNFNNEDCVMLTFPDFWLADINCQLMRPFVCELSDK